MENKWKSPIVLTRRQFLEYGVFTGLTTGLSAALMAEGCRQRRSDSRSKNVILISIDTLRADHLGCYGYSRPTSPALDKLASEGLLFEDVSSPSPWTLPAHASLLTGLYPNRNGLKSHEVSMPGNIITLAQILKEHGFLTAAIVNSHYVSQRYGFNRGFDSFNYIAEDVGKIQAPEIDNEAYKWLSKYSREPFFLFLHYYDVHSDYRSLPPYKKRFVRPYKGKADGTTSQLLSFRKKQFALKQTDAAHLIDLYDASIRQMDDGLARLFGFLEKKELLERSLVIITSDHGEEFLEHGDVLHGRTQFQELIQVPLIISNPELAKARRIRQIASLVDVMPTILAMLNIAIPAGLDGFDLSSFWRADTHKPPQRFIFAEADHNNAANDIKLAVRHPRYKLHYDRLAKQMRLYDLLQDPYEKFDVASEHSYLVDTMFRRLKDFMSIKNVGQMLPPLSTQQLDKLRSLGYLQ